MSVVFSITVGTIGILSQFYNVYTGVRCVARDWAEADFELAKFDISMQVAVSVANQGLHDLAKAPSDEIALSPQAKEIRQRCANILETLLRQCEKEMVALGERSRSPMKPGEKATWVIHVKDALARCTNSLQEWNEQTKKVLEIGDRWATPPISSSPAQTPFPQADTLWVEKLARMAVARDMRLRIVQPNTLWVSPDELEFEETSTPPIIDLGFMRHQKLKLRPRRFGYRVGVESKEPIMVEFRQYYQNLKAEKPGEYEAVRSNIMELAYVLFCANSNNGTNEGTASFPSVPFIGFSELPQNSPPCFLLVYGWSEMKSLYEVIADENTKPSPDHRFKLAIELGKSLFAFHTTGYVHGLLNTDNIFLSGHNGQTTGTRTLLAGFDISRSKSNGTNKLDVKDPDLRLYIHPDRLGQGQDKDANHAPYDAYSLGIIWLEIGLWLPLRKLQGMRRESDKGRRKKIVRACQSEKLLAEMGVEYVGAIRYLLGEFPEGSSWQDSNSAFMAGFVSVFGEPNAAQAVTMLPVNAPIPTQNLAQEGEI